MKPDVEMMKRALHCKCPKCGQGDIFPSTFSADLKDKCDECGFDLTKNDTADGPAVFLIFILGTLLVPLAILLDIWLEPPLWVQAVLWTVLAVLLTLGGLKPVKAYIVALEYKHRPEAWNED